MQFVLLLLLQSYYICCYLCCKSNYKLLTKMHLVLVIKVEHQNCKKSLQRQAIHHLSRDKGWSGSVLWKKFHQSTLCYPHTHFVGCYPSCDVLAEWFGLLLRRTYSSSTISKEGAAQGQSRLLPGMTVPHGDQSTGHFCPCCKVINEDVKEHG